jgi:hypothetical protein
MTAEKVRIFGDKADDPSCEISAQNLLYDANGEDVELNANHIEFKFTDDEASSAEFSGEGVKVSGPEGSLEASADDLIIFDKAGDVKVSLNGEGLKVEAEDNGNILLTGEKLEVFADDSEVVASIGRDGIYYSKDGNLIMRMNEDGVSLSRGGEDCTLTNEEMKFVNDNGGVTDTGAGRININDEDMQILAVMNNGDHYISMSDGDDLYWRFTFVEFSFGQTWFELMDLGEDSKLSNRDSGMVNKILALRNLLSIEFNQNNTSTGDTGTIINYLCTSTNVANTSYAYSDNHVISSLGVKNLISQHSADIRYH